MSTAAATPPIEQPKAHDEPRQMVVQDNRPHEIQLFELQQRAAKLFAASGLFTDIKGQTHEQAIAQAFVKISLGHSMGFTPAESMTGIDLIQGRVAVGSNLRAARMQRGGWSWDILQLDDKGCRLQLKKDGKQLMQEQIDGQTGDVTQVPTIVAFMVEDAARAGLITKDNYKKNPRNMFFARAITNAQRWYAPGILGVDILDRTEAESMPPLIDAEAAASNRAKTGTDATADRLVTKYGKKESEPPQPIVDILEITDADTQLEQGDTPNPQPQPESAETPASVVESATGTSRASTRRRGHQPATPHGQPLSFDSERQPGEDDRF